MQSRTVLPIPGFRDWVCLIPGLIPGLNRARLWLAIAGLVIGKIATRTTRYRFELRNAHSNRAVNLHVSYRLVVKTGSGKTKTKTELFETKTKTANGSMKQNAHSSRKNYFYQKLQRHWLMSSLQLSIAFSKANLYLKKNRKQIDGEIHGRPWEIFETD